MQGMSFEMWLLAVGSLLLLMALAHPVVQRLPITTTIVYLLIGIVLGPWWHGFIRVDPILDAPWLHRATEISLIVSLFTVGMKLRLPLRDARLRPALCLASVSMILTVALVAGAAMWLLHLPLGAAILLGGVLAPTDPVLASDVQMQNPHDQDRLRLTLSIEGGLNDGTAFPLVMLGLGLLGLHELGAGWWRWWVIDGFWALLGGLAIGGATGFGIGELVHYVNRRRGRPIEFGEYLVLGLIGVSYGAAVVVKASGFLAVFAAGVALRAVERHATGSASAGERDAADARVPEHPVVTPGTETTPAYFTGALLATNEQLERILEVALVLVVGAVLMVAGLSVDGLWFGALLFFVLRPLAALPLLLIARFSRFEFGAISWFGIRGIGSIYYLMFAIESGLSVTYADLLVSLTLTVVALSIIVHGVSVTPLLNYYSRLVARRRETGSRRDRLPAA